MYDLCTDEEMLALMDALNDVMLSLSLATDDTMSDIVVGLVTMSAKLGADIMLHEYTKQPYHLGEEETESIKSVKEVVTKPVIIIDDGEYTPFKEGE